MKTIAVTGLALAGLAAMGALGGADRSYASNNGPEGDVVVDATGNLHAPHAYQMHVQREFLISSAASDL